MEQFSPQIGFAFAVQILGSSSRIMTSEGIFQEASGLNVEMKLEDITEGSENRFIHKVPSRISNDNNLVLKRGLIVASSDFGDWCQSHFSGGLDAASNSNEIKTKDIIVHLLDTNKQQPIMSWAFVRAYPVKWEISSLNAEENSYVIESLSLTYAYFSVL